MEQGFFVGFDNDMEDFSNLVGQGKLSQAYKDLKTSTGSKNIIGVGFKSFYDPKKTISKLKDVSNARKTIASGVPKDSSAQPQSGNMSSTPDMTTSESGASMGESKIFDGDDAELKEAKMKGLKIVGIGVGALVVIGAIIYFVRR